MRRASLLLGVVSSVFAVTGLAEMIVGFELVPNHGAFGIATVLYVLSGFADRVRTRTGASQTSGRASGGNAGAGR